MKSVCVCVCVYVCVCVDLELAVDKRLTECVQDKGYIEGQSSIHVGTCYRN